MTNARRGRGSRQGFYVCWVAALGLALSACGGGSASSSAGAAAQAADPANSSIPDQPSSSASTGTTASSTTAASSTAAASSTTAGSGLTSGAPATATAGTVTINWMPPTENVDGTALTDLAGYNIHYGTSSGNYTQTIAVSNPGIATYVVSNLTAGTYYFTVAAVNSAGTESPLSSEVKAIVN